MLLPINQFQDVGSRICLELSKANLVTHRRFTPRPFITQCVDDAAVIRACRFANGNGLHAHGGRRRSLVVSVYRESDNWCCTASVSFRSVLLFANRPAVDSLLRLNACPVILQMNSPSRCVAFMSPCRSSSFPCFRRVHWRRLVVKKRIRLS